MIQYTGRNMFLSALMCEHSTGHTTSCHNFILWYSDWPHHEPVHSEYIVSVLLYRLHNCRRLLDIWYVVIVSEILTRFWQSLHAPMISGGLESARKIELFPLNMFQWGFDPTKPLPEKWHSVSILMMGWASVTWTFYRPQYMYSMELIHIWHCDWPYHECEYQWWWLGYVKVVIYTYSQGLWKDILILDGPRVTLFSEW